MYNKKGQNSTISVTIAIVLGVALIVFLIWGFTTNWAMFRSTSGAYGGTTVDIVKQGCERACENGFKTEFCDVKKSVIDQNGNKVNAACVDEPLNLDPVKMGCSFRCDSVKPVVDASDGSASSSPSDTNSEAPAE